ncbi:iron chelate uptake ABC transporter family permease subunit [Shigella flexneri]
MAGWRGAQQLAGVGWCGPGYIRRSNAGVVENPSGKTWTTGVSNGAGVRLIAAVLLRLATPGSWALGLCAECWRAYHHFNTFTFRPSSSLDQSVIAGWRWCRFICSALMTWAVCFSTSVDLRQLMYWMMGGFGGVTGGKAG